jgi:hypothetical protein
MLQTCKLLSSNGTVIVIFIVLREAYLFEGLKRQIITFSMSADDFKKFNFFQEI